MAFRALQDSDFDRYNYQGSSSSARERLEDMMEQNREMIARVTDAALVGGTAFAFGWYQGRNNGMPELFGLPYDLLAAIVLHGVTLAGYGGAYEEYIHSIANGALASYAVNAGARLGLRQRCEASAAATAAGTPWPVAEQPANCPLPAGGGGAGAWDYTNGSYAHQRAAA